MCDIPDWVHDVMAVVAPGSGLVRGAVDAIPTMPEVTGAEDAKKAARKQKAQFEADQRQAEQEKIQAAERKRMNTRATSERLAAGRASTILTGPQGAMGAGTGASRALLPN